jgi:hypothetical protein
VGVATLYLGGVWLGGDPRAALASALLVSGMAGYWFFSATIDTYIPSLWAATVALLFALKCLRDQNLVDYGWLSLAASVAFLFRTDRHCSPRFLWWALQPPVVRILEFGLRRRSVRCSRYDPIHIEGVIYRIMV